VGCYKTTMSRRLLAVLTAFCLAALGLSAVALAHDGSSEKHGTKAGNHVRHGKYAGPLGGLAGATLTSLAGRLSVAPADLKAAVTAVAKEQRAKRKAAGKPHAEPDLAALKTELAASLATKLGTTPKEILTAVRAELDARLTQAVAAGWVTQKGHDLALACFDAPATCDLKALRAEVRFFGHKQQHGHRHHHKQGSKPAASSTTPSGTMTPGGRSSSAPLR
jgi:hypothetical protein